MNDEVFHFRILFAFEINSHSNSVRYTASIKSDFSNKTKNLFQALNKNFPIFFLFYSSLFSFKIKKLNLEMRISDSKSSFLAAVDISIKSGKSQENYYEK